MVIKKVSAMSFKVTDNNRINEIEPKNSIFFVKILNKYCEIKYLLLYLVKIKRNENGKIIKRRCIC